MALTRCRQIDLRWRRPFVHRVAVCVSNPMFKYPTRLTQFCRIYQIQAFVTELVSQFEFSPTEDTKRVRRQLCGGMSLTLEGDHRHSTLPLTLSLVDQDACTGA